MGLSERVTGLSEGVTGLSEGVAGLSEGVATKQEDQTDELAKTSGIRGTSTGGFIHFRLLSHLQKE